jgi:hypothetical protein
VFFNKERKLNLVPQYSPYPRLRKGRTTNPLPRHNVRRNQVLPPNSPSSYQTTPRDEDLRVDQDRELSHRHHPGYHHLGLLARTEGSVGLVKVRVSYPDGVSSWVEQDAGDVDVEQEHFGYSAIESEFAFDPSEPTIS